MSRSRVTASALSSNYLIDNIANQFDGKAAVFPVRVGGDDYTVTDPYQLDIYIGSQLLRPYVAVVDNVFRGTVYTTRQGYTITNYQMTAHIHSSTPNTSRAVFPGCLSNTDAARCCQIQIQGL
jgi:hypothetical protein